MSEKGQPSAQNAADAGSKSSVGGQASGNGTTTAPKKPVADGNPAFRMMGLPRLRLPSRNWLIFLSVTGAFASAVIYDKYQTRRVREKWCSLVSHIAEEPLDSHRMARKMTIYLAAPPGDGLRTAREHFHNYIKPVLVAAAMDWDVVEGRKEGDVRYKTAERVRKRRRKEGEGKPTEDEESAMTVDAIRQKNGTREFDGIAGDIVVGRHTWKEYVRGLHEGWLGPVDAPEPLTEEANETSEGGGQHNSFGEQPVAASTVQTVEEATASTLSEEASSNSSGVEAIVSDDASPVTDESAKEKERAESGKDEELPKPRQPPPFLQPSEYSTAVISPRAPDVIGPSIGISFPHILGFRNTPLRIYRFLNRRHLADTIGHDVAAAVLASHAPYNSLKDASFDKLGTADASPDSNEVGVLQHEEKNWWKTTYNPRKEHEESVWIEDVVLDERVAGRMRAFQLLAADEEKSKTSLRRKTKESQAGTDSA